MGQENLSLSEEKSFFLHKNSSHPSDAVAGEDIKRPVLKVRHSCERQFLRNQEPPQSEEFLTDARSYERAARR